MVYLTTHSTHFILRLYGVEHMVKDDSNNERGNPMPPHGLLFPISSKGSFTYIHIHTCMHEYIHTYIQGCLGSRMVSVAD